MYYLKCNIYVCRKFFLDKTHPTCLIKNCYHVSYQETIDKMETHQIEHLKRDGYP